MSAETITIVLSALGIVATLGSGMFAGTAWLVRRMDSLAERSDLRLAEFRAGTRAEFADFRAGVKDEFAAVRAEIADLRTEITGLRTETRAEFTSVRTEIAADRSALTDVKVASARWEGPPPRFRLAH